MDRRRLGRTGLQSTVLGLGGAPLAREGCTDEDALHTIWASLEAGVNLIDTAPLYGDRRSEALIGRALRERSDLAHGCILCTKTGRYIDHEDYTYDRTLRSVAQSMALLGVEHIHIVHIHDVATAEHMRELLGMRAVHAALRHLQAQGLIDFIGVGTRNLDVLQFAIKSGEFDVLMIANQYNLLEQAGRATIELAAQHDVGVLIAGAFATGILAKGAVPGARYGYHPATEEVLARTSGLQALCAKWECELPTVAVRYCLRGPAAHAVAVLGARSREQAQGNASSVERDAPEGFWLELDTLVAGARA